MSDRTTELVRNALHQIAELTCDTTPAVVYLGRDNASPLVFVLHDYWPSKDRALALGQAATAEMIVGEQGAAQDCRYGVLWTHVVVPRASIDFADETGFGWRRLEDHLGLEYTETEALLAFEFDIDKGFDITVVALTRGNGAIRFDQAHIYDAAAVIEPLPGLILMRTIAINAPVKEYS